MIAGRMRYMLTIFEPQSGVDGFGGKQVKFIEKGTIHAERTKSAGSMGEEVGEMFTTYTAEYNIRDVHKIKEGYRVEEKGGYLYTVSAVIENRQKGMKTLICTRVNE